VFTPPPVPNTLSHLGSPISPSRTHPAPRLPHFLRQRLTLGHHLPSHVPRTQYLHPRVHQPQQPRRLPLRPRHHTRPQRNQHLPLAPHNSQNTRRTPTPHPPRRIPPTAITKVTKPPLSLRSPQPQHRNPAQSLHHPPHPLPLPPTPHHPVQIPPQHITPNHNLHPHQRVTKPHQAPIQPAMRRAQSQPELDTTTIPISISISTPTTTTTSPPQPPTPRPQQPLTTKLNRQGPPHNISLPREPRLGEDDRYFG
jgi:hypothetical protein